MTVKLDITVLAGVSSGDVFHFHPEEGAGVTIGRAAECDMVLQDPLVSRRHARIEHRLDGFFIVDEGSSHGTVHMGFTLKHGPENARPLSDGDEFKIGDLLFRVNFSGDTFRARTKMNELQSVDALDASKKKGSNPLTKRHKLMLLLAVVAFAALAFLFTGGKKGLPPQKSGQLITLPDFRVTGYWPGGAKLKKEEFDTAHADKAQYSVPSSDLLIEYDFRSEAKVDLFLDEGLVEHIDPAPLWQSRQLIIRGIPLGRERKVIFDNLSYPPVPGEGGKMVRWAVRDVRMTPLSTQSAADVPFDEQLRGCIGLVEGVDKSPEGLFLLVRGLQTALVALLNEAKVDAVGYPISLETDGTIDASKVGELQERLELLARDRLSGSAPDATARHTREMVMITAQLDAELWRRVNSRISKAQLSSKVKDYIEAHDQLISAQSMFPAEGDYRWAILQKLFKNEKVVPKRVRQNPQKFRK